MDLDGALGLAVLVLLVLSDLAVVAFLEVVVFLVADFFSTVFLSEVGLDSVLFADGFVVAVFGTFLASFVPPEAPVK